MKIKLPVKIKINNSFAVVARFMANILIAGIGIIPQAIMEGQKIRVLTMVIVVTAIGLWTLMQIIIDLSHGVSYGTRN